MVNLDNITLIDATAVHDRITTLPAATMLQICEAVEIAVGCER